MKQEIFNILVKKQDQRTDTDWQLLYNYMSSISFFQKYVVSGYKNIPQECCKVLSPLHMKKGDIVFYIKQDLSYNLSSSFYNIDTEGNKFYIILQGQVGLFTKKNEEGPGNKFDNLVQVKTLQDGDYFGELGLLNFKTRSATVQCLTDSYFGVIDKISFDKILKKLEQDILQERIDAFANDNPLLKFSSKHTIKQLYFNAIFKKCSPNEFIILSGDPLESIFIIKSGQYKLVKEYNRKSVMNEFEEIDEEHEEQELQVLNQDTYFLQLQKQKKKLISILDLGKGQIFGYEDFLLKREIYSYGIVCKEGGEVIMIRANDFRKRLMSDKLTMIYLKQQMSLQSNYIEQREATIVRSMEGYTQFYFEQEYQKDKREMMTKMCHNSTGVKLDLPQTVIDKARAQEIEDKKSNNKNKVHSKLSHFKDELSHDFQNHLVKNYSDRFGDMDLTKLKVHIPQEIVQKVNYKLSSKYNTKIGKSPPQLSQSILDYFKLKSPSSSSIVPNINTLSSLSTTKNINIVTDYTLPLFIQTAKIEQRNVSNQNSPTLNYIHSSPLQSSKQIVSSQMIESPLKSAQSRKTSFFNSKSYIGFKSLPQSIQEIDQNLNDIDSEDESNQSSPHKNNRKMRQQSEIILQQRSGIEFNEPQDIKNQKIQQENQLYYSTDLIKQNINDEQQSQKIHSFHLSSKSNGQSQIKQMNFLNIKEEQSQAEQEETFTRPQKLKIFDSLHSKKKQSNKQISQSNQKPIENNQNNGQQSQNNKDYELSNQSSQKNLQLSMIEYNFNKPKSNNLKNQELNDIQNTLQNNNTQIKTPTQNSINIVQQQNINQQYSNQVKLLNLNKTQQIIKQNSNQINIISPTLTPQSNSTVSCNQIHFKHSDSIDSNQSANTQKSQVKSNCNYSSLFKPYTPKQVKKASSIFSQVDSPQSKINKDNHLDKSNESEQHYLLPSNLIKKPQNLQTTMASSLGQSKFGLNQLDQQDKLEADSSNNSILSPLNQTKAKQSQLQNFIFENNISKQRNTINIINNYVDDDQVNRDQIENVNQTEGINKNINPIKNNNFFNFNAGNSSYLQINQLTKKKDKNSSLQINEIQEYPQFEQSEKTIKSAKQGNTTVKNQPQQQQNFQRMMSSSGSPKRKSDQINIYSRSSIPELNRADSTIEEANQNKTPSQLIIDMLSQIDNLSIAKPNQQENRIFYQTPTGKKISLKQSKPTYKFEQAVIEEKTKRQQKPSLNYFSTSQSSETNSQQFFKLERTLSQIISPKNSSFSIQIKGQNSQQQIQKAQIPSRKSDNIQLDNSLNIQISPQKIINPQKNANSINKSSEFIKLRRPLSSATNQSMNQKLQSQGNLIQNKRKINSRPHSAKPIDFFQKILQKKMV